jgi:hypothetical protein
MNQWAEHSDETSHVLLGLATKHATMKIGVGAWDSNRVVVEGTQAVG